MDWESKFSSIVRETESNLAKVKHRLGSARASTSSALTLNGPPAGYRDSQMRSAAGPLLAQNHTYPYEPLDPNVAQRLGNLEISGEPNGLTLEQSQGVLTLLSDKLDEQTRAIQSLVRTVNRLEDEKDQSHKQIKDLKDELSNVQTRMAERGVDLQTEHKIDKWRRDVASEIHHLQSQLKYHRARNEEDGIGASQASSFIREIRDLKRYFQDEMNSVRRDVESLKSRIVRVEVDVTSMSSENRDIGRRHDRIEQNLRDMNDRQKLMSPMDMRAMPDQNFGRIEVAELKSSIKLLENQLANVESKVQQAKIDKPAYQRPKTKQKYLTVTSTTDLLSPMSSDIDLSDFSTDDLDNDLKPKASTKNKLSRGESELDLDDDDDVDFGLTTDDLISTGIDTEDLI